MIKTAFVNVLILFLVGCNAPKDLRQGVGYNKNSVVLFGADATGKRDASNAFKDALSSPFRMITVPIGIYLIDETIELEKHLKLEAGAKIIRTKKGSNGPIFWLSKSYAILEGESKQVEIASEKPLEEGIIKIGHDNSKVNNKNILYAQVKNLTITGPRENTNRKSVGILLFNAQNKGDGMTTSYFHSLENLIVQYTDIGIHMVGMSNANSISKVIFNRVGNNNNEAAILISGAMENRIYDIFHHYSKNATTIIMESYIDANGEYIVPVYNYIFGVIAEQGGEDAICADVRSGQYNQIGVLCNTDKGNNYFKGFESNKNKILIH